MRESIYYLLSNTAKKKIVDEVMQEIKDRKIQMLADHARSEIRILVQSYLTERLVEINERLKSLETVFLEKKDED